MPEDTIPPPNINEYPVVGAPCLFCLRTGTARRVATYKQQTIVSRNLTKINITPYSQRKSLQNISGRS